MKKLIIIGLIFSKLSASDYNIVLLGEDKDGYCFTKIKLENLKKLPEVNECTQIFRLLDKHQLLKVLYYSDYSSLLKNEDDLYKVDLDPQNPSNCYFEMKEKLSPHDKHWPFITRRIARLAECLCTFYYTYLCKEDCKEANDNVNQQLVKQLTDIIGVQKNTYLFKASDKQTISKCMCLITEYDLNDSILSYLEDHFKTY